MSEPDSIRLLRLYAAENTESKIRISLSITQLEHAPEYEALSYTWANDDGDASLSQSVDCRGSSIAVTENCLAALRRLRREDRDRILWVDSICINQNKGKERNHQVRVMGSIFRRAVRVLIWLGNAPGLAQKVNEQQHPTDSGTRRYSHLPCSAVFMQYLRPMAAEIRRCQEQGDDATRAPLYVRFVSQGVEREREGHYSHLTAGSAYITSCRWWKRVWVVQEVALAKSALLVCGDQTADYADFKTLFELDIFNSTVQSYWGNAQNQLVIVARASMLRQESNWLEALLSVLEESRQLGATDPRDHLYGILGLFDKYSAMLPSPDYTRTASEIFTDLVLMFLRLSKSVDVLSNVATMDSSSSRPSWVPDWSMRTPYEKTLKKCFGGPCV